MKPLHWIGEVSWSILDKLCRGQVARRFERAPRSDANIFFSLLYVDLACIETWVWHGIWIKERDSGHKGLWLFVSTYLGWRIGRQQVEIMIYVYTATERANLAPSYVGYYVPNTKYGWRLARSPDQRPRIATLASLPLSLALTFWLFTFPSTTTLPPL